MVGTLLFGVFTGCDTPKVQGPPKGIDMSKDYSPAAKVGAFSPTDMQKDYTKSKAQPKPFPAPASK